MAAATKPQRLPSAALRELGSSRGGVKDTEYRGPQTANTGSGPSVQKFSFPNARQYAPYKTLATRWARPNASAVSDLFHATELYQLWNGALLKRTGSLLWPRQFVVVWKHRLLRKEILFKCINTLSKQDSSYFYFDQVTCVPCKCFKQS